MISIKLDVTKINKAKLFKGEKGTYLDLTLMDNKNGVDKWGNSGFVVQSLSKEERERGEKADILGNWKHIGKAAPKQQEPVADSGDSFDDVPF
jgi:hypothetical protein